MNLESILKNLQIQELNQMQKSTYKTTENNQDTVLLSPTGSGKTLAFLLPLLQELKPEENTIQSLVLVPSRELALQIESVFKSMNTSF